MYQLPRSRHLFQNSDGSLNMQSLGSSAATLLARCLVCLRMLLAGSLLCSPCEDEPHGQLDAGGHGRVLCGSGRSEEFY